MKMSSVFFFAKKCTRKKKCDFIELPSQISDEGEIDLQIYSQVQIELGTQSLGPGLVWKPSLCCSVNGREGGFVEGICW